jgi:membrane associated rhomboid family serine protease
MTPWVMRLLIANIVMFFLVAPPNSTLYYLLALVPYRLAVQPWGIVTYMFLHANGMHILFNMIMLFFFGPRLEAKLGSSGFLKLYFISGAGGGLLSGFLSPGASVVGASAAVFGITIGFARYWPRENIYIWGVLPVQAWVLAVFLVITNLMSGLSGAQSGIAHFAHLGGALFGWLYLYVRDRRTKAVKTAWQKKVAPQSDGVSDKEALRRWATIQPEGLHELNRGEVEELLAKAMQQGVRSLTPAERAFLDRMAHR